MENQENHHPLDISFAVNEFLNDVGELFPGVRSKELKRDCQYMQKVMKAFTKYSQIDRMNEKLDPVLDDFGKHIKSTLMDDIHKKEDELLSLNQPFVELESRLVNIEDNILLPVVELLNTQSSLQELAHSNEYLKQLAVTE